MQLYHDYTVSPLGKLFYQTVWKQLEHIQGQKVLDFGSGFGFTAKFLAQHNDVTAVEMLQDMIDAGEKTPNYTQLCGDITTLKGMADASYDVVICHLVFEFVDNAQEIFAELVRVLKKGGIVSIVRHNRAGRIIQAVVQQYNLDDAKQLLQGGDSYSSAFGNIKYLENADIELWAQSTLQVKAVHGVRALASLHDAALQQQESWLPRMLEIEWELLKDPHFIAIAYFNHLLLQKTM